MTSPRSFQAGTRVPGSSAGHLIAQEDVPRLLDVGKAHIYIMDLGPDELHEEDAARRLARAGRRLATASR